MNTILALTLAGSMSLPSGVTPSTPPRPTLTAQLAALTRAPAATAKLAGTGAALAPPRGDSVKEGALIVGSIAAVAMGVFVYKLCRGFEGETVDDPNCWAAGLRAGAIFGVAGAALGAGIDGLFTRRPAFSASVRVRF